MHIARVGERLPWLQIQFRISRSFRPRNLANLGSKIRFWIRRKKHTVVVDIASSVQKVSYSKPLHNKSRCLNTMWSFLTFKVINTWIFLYFQKVLTMKLWRNTQFMRAILFAVRGESVSKEIGGWVRLPVWRHVWRQWFSKWRAKCSSKRLIKFSKLLRKYCSDYLDLEIYDSYFHRNVQWCNEF